MLFATAPAGSQSVAADPAFANAIEDLVVANHILADQGVFDAYGHVSMRDPGNPNRYLMSRPLAPSQVTAADIMEFDLNSNPIDQRGRDLLVERFLHGAIYKARPDVHAVVHSHSPAVIPFGVTSVPLRPVLHTASFLWPGVPVWDIRDTTPVSDLLVRNDVLGKALATALGNKPVVLMRGHGDVVVGRTVQTAVVRAIYTEVNARVLTAALRSRRLDQLHLGRRRRATRPAAGRRDAGVEFMEGPRDEEVIALFDCEHPDGAALRHLGIFPREQQVEPALHARASTPQPDCTAMYCLPSTAKDTGTPVTPELVGNSQSSLPVLASNARNMRSLVPPENTRPPPVASIGPQFCDGRLVVHTRLPVSTFHACTSPMWSAPRPRSPPFWRRRCSARRRREFLCRLAA